MSEGRPQSPDNRENDRTSDADVNLSELTAVLERLTNEFESLKAEQTELRQGQHGLNDAVNRVGEELAEVKHTLVATRNKAVTFTHLMSVLGIQIALATAIIVGGGVMAKIAFDQIKHSEKQLTGTLVASIDGINTDLGMRIDDIDGEIEKNIGAVTETLTVSVDAQGTAIENHKTAIGGQLQGMEGGIAVIQNNVERVSDQVADIDERAEQVSELVDGMQTRLEVIGDGLSVLTGQLSPSNGDGVAGVLSTLIDFLSVTGASYRGPSQDVVAEMERLLDDVDKGELPDTLSIAVLERICREWLDLRNPGKVRLTAERFADAGRLDLKDYWNGMATFQESLDLLRTRETPGANRWEEQMRKAKEALARSGRSVAPLDLCWSSVFLSESNAASDETNMPRWPAARLEARLLKEVVIRAMLGDLAKPLKPFPLTASEYDPRVIRMVYERIQLLDQAGVQRADVLCDFVEKYPVESWAPEAGSGAEVIDLPDATAG